MNGMLELEVQSPPRTRLPDFLKTTPKNSSSSSPFPGLAFYLKLFGGSSDVAASSSNSTWSNRTADMSSEEEEDLLDQITSLESSLTQTTSAGSR